MSEPSDLERLAALDARIERLKADNAPKPRKADGHVMANNAWRMVTELVAGLMIGFGIGYGLDTLLGTLPLFLVIFILLGLAAGIRTMMRTAAEVQAQAIKDAGQSAMTEGDRNRG
jgi:ATP synthase protein I